MVHEVYVFGDSHWRVFFPFVNHGAASDNVSHEEGGVRTIDTIANELSGSTMWGLLNPKSKNGARNRILSTLDRIGGAENVGLVFGEVDARFHHDRYFVDGKLSYGRIWELLSRYVRFVQEDLLMTRRVRGNVFIYHGFGYPRRGETLRHPGDPLDAAWRRADLVNITVGALLPEAFSSVLEVIPIVVREEDAVEMVSPDGVHLDPAQVYPRAVLPVMQRYLSLAEL